MIGWSFSLATNWITVRKQHKRIKNRTTTEKKNGIFGLSPIDLVDYIISRDILKVRRTNRTKERVSYHRSVLLKSVWRTFPLIRIDQVDVHRLVCYKKFKRLSTCLFFFLQPNLKQGKFIIIYSIVRHFIPTLFCDDVTPRWKSRTIIIIIIILLYYKTIQTRRGGRKHRIKMVDSKRWNNRRHFNWDFFFFPPFPLSNEWNVSGNR